MLQQTRTAIAAIGFGFVMTLAATQVAGQDVKSNHMPGVDFSKFHTYKWVPIQSASHPNQIVDQEIKQSIDSQLASKGLTKTEGNQADLYVGYQVAVDREKQWNAYGTGGGWGWGGGMATATQSTINVGSLVLDMYDPSTKQLVWTGTATKTIDPSSKQTKNEERLNKAMAKLLKDFPPK
jgi:hypothetical protein